ncbi:PLP-dependent cysteine synthase family protein [Breoghania sp.]|uniref:PLP-dependent cysteine synthase family protein n=1 Tax=Breoghania sp. TaxID=2065378 RepID=UPI002633AE45|nr:PLP-dependent cysteine synthase family protein [Breoghania sp.]MDJ0933273.1 PLP-dependent cysteine synthase family protein [Breoghania sp.]
MAHGLAPLAEGEAASAMFRPLASPDILPPLPDLGGCDWVRHAIALVEGETQRTADTHLIKMIFPGLAGISVYFKNESTHPTGSLKHRLARSLVLYGLYNGLIRENTTLVEASSGSTVVSEAYFARLLNLPFIAVMTSSTSRQKVEAIEGFGGKCHFVEGACEVYGAARRIAAETNGHYLDQFTFAERTTDWRHGNAAESIFAQMQCEPEPVPEWVVMSVGTGGTSATIGRHIRYCNYTTRLCVADVENSVFFDAYKFGDRTIVGTGNSRIEGIGRPRVEPSFVSEVIDHMVSLPDVASIAAMTVLSKRLFLVGGSTGTNFMALCWIAAQMKEAGREGPLVTLICDSGARYVDTYHDAAWLKVNGFEIAPYVDALETFLDTGKFAAPLGGPGFRS